MPSLFKRRYALGWHPDADAENAPEGALLRADNLVLDQEGVLALRQGSTIVDEALEGDGGVHSLASFELPVNETDEKTHRFAAVDDRVYRNGTNLGAQFTGLGDVAFGSDAYQVFMARGTTRRKYDGTTFNRWDIPAPDLAPTLDGASAVTTTVASFASAESPAFTVTEGTSAFITGYDAAASGALELTVNKANGRASAYKKWPSDQNFLKVGGVAGGDTDILDLYVALSAPESTDTITVMFGLGTGTDPFLDDYFYFDFRIKDKITVDIKDPASAVSSVYGVNASETIRSILPTELVKTRTPQQVGGILARLGRFAGPRSRERKDSVQASPAWGHLSVTRGQFNRVGNTEGRSWSTVRGFKVVAQTTAGQAYTVALDSAVIFGGGVRALTGKYRVCYRYVRSFLNGTYFELSPPSPVSEEIVLNQQGLNVTIPAAAVSGADGQVNQIWVYMFGGFLDQFYRIAVMAGTNAQKTMYLDSFNPTIDGNDMDDAAERTGFTQWGLTIPGFTADASRTALIRKSELETIRENVTIEPFPAGPPENIVAIEGPINGRMFCLTSEGWLYISLQNSPSNFSISHTLDLRKYGDPLWMKRSVGGVHVGTTGDVILIEGTGDESEDHLTVDLYPTPLHVGNPPVDASIFADGSTLVYRAADGLMTLSGVQALPVNKQGTSLLWRGVERHGTQPLNITKGRFRLAVDNHVLYMIAPEGDDTHTGTVAAGDTESITFDSEASATDDAYNGQTVRIATGQGVGQERVILDYVGSTKVATVSAWTVVPTTANTFEIKNAGSPTIWRYDTIRQRWYRTTYSATFSSLIRDAAGNILAGDLDGNVWQLESGTQDDGVNIPIVLWTPIDDGGAPLSKKTPFDLQVEADTGGNDGTVAVHLEGTGSAETSYTFSSTDGAMHQQSLYGLADFVRVQLRVTGSFFRFALRWLNLSYRAHPPQQYSLDTGYLTPPGGGELAWVSRVEMSLQSPSDVQLVPIFDDVAKDTLSIPVIASKTSTYSVLLKRGQDKGRRPRFVLKTTAAASTGNTGLELYWMRVHFRGTGNKTDNVVEIAPNAVVQGAA